MIPPRATPAPPDCDVTGDDRLSVAFVSTRRALPQGYPRRTQPVWPVVGEANEFALRNPGSPPWLAPLIGLTITGWTGFGIVLVMLWRAA